jgi:RNA polymerase sigma-70 factor (ECF subfamily)
LDPRELKAFEILARENTRMLMVYLRSLVNDPAAIDDLFQETMVVAWRRLDECDLTRPFGPWLRGIAARLVMAYYRKRKQQPVFMQDAVLSLLDRKFESISAQVGDTWDEKVSALHDCLQSLPVQQSTVIRARYFDDLSMQQMAEHLDVSLEACKKRLQRARAMIAECLKTKGMFFAGEAVR